MNLLHEWIINIVIFILLAMIIDLLLPETQMKKYAKLVTGLLLIVMMITPVFNILSTDVESLLNNFSAETAQLEKTLEKNTEDKKNEILSSQQAYILEQMAVPMKKDVEKEMIDRYGMIITNVQIIGDVTMDEGLKNIQKVVVSLQSESEETAAVIEKVSINLNEKSENNKIDKETETEIRSTLSGRWDVAASKIEIVYEGRNR